MVADTLFDLPPAKPPWRELQERHGITSWQSTDMHNDSIFFARKIVDKIHSSGVTEMVRGEG